MKLTRETYISFTPMCTSTPRRVEMRDDYDEDFDLECICFRKEEVYNCQRCYQFYEGRLSEKCLLHPEVSWFLDVTTCPYCHAPKSLLKISDQKSMMLAEGKDMPDDNDLDDL